MLQVVPVLKEFVEALSPMYEVMYIPRFHCELNPIGEAAIFPCNSYASARYMLVTKSNCFVVVQKCSGLL